MRLAASSRRARIVLGREAQLVHIGTSGCVGVPNQLQHAIYETRTERAEPRGTRLRAL